MVRIISADKTINVYTPKSTTLPEKVRHLQLQPRRADNESREEPALLDTHFITLYTPI